MTKLPFPALLLMASIFGSLVVACTPNSPQTLAATALPSSTPGGIAPPTMTAIMLPSSTPSRDTTKPPRITTTGGFFALSVANINASATWYTEKLGLQIVLQPPKANQSTVIVLEGGGLIVELIQRDGAQPLSKLAPTMTDRMLLYGIVKVGVVVEDFDQTVAILRERNVPIVLGPFPATAEQRANIVIQDNEGNLIQFIGK